MLGASSVPPRLLRAALRVCYRNIRTVAAYVEWV